MPSLEIHFGRGGLAGGLLLMLCASAAVAQNGVAEFKATGWFRLDQHQGRDLLVTPGGEAFLMRGINHVPGDTDPERLLRNFKEWGFNSLGYNPSEKLIDGTRLPYLIRYDAAEIRKNNIRYHFPDVFDREWQRRIEAEVAELCAKHRDDRNLIGYVWTDTPTLDLFLTRGLRGTDWVQEIRALPADSPGKQRYAAFLATRHAEDSGYLTSHYGVEQTDAASLAAHDFSGLLIGDLLVQADDLAFFPEIMRAYYGTIGPAFRNNDPHHLIFSEVFIVGDHPDSAVVESAKYVDAISIQPGDSYTPLCPGSDRFAGEIVDALHQLAHKPVLIVDHQIAFPTPDQPKTIWTCLDSEAAAARSTEDFITEALARPYMLGYIRCQYQDGFSEPRQAARRGLVDREGHPYPLLLDAHRRAFAKASAALQDLLEVGRSDE